MNIHHGSNTVIEMPDLSYSRKNLDFGRGFYLTSYANQAERWAKRVALRKGGQPIVNVYNLAEFTKKHKVLRFANDREWVEFVVNARRGSEDYLSYDVIIGGVANDDVYEAVGMYFRGLWDLDRTLEELKYYEVNDQICLVNQEVLSEILSFEFSYEVI